MARFGIAGAGGLVGGSLCKELERRGHEVVRLVRRDPAHRGERTWIPGDSPDPALLDGLDGLVNLAGSPISRGLWTSEGRRDVLESRIRSTRHLAGCAAISGTPVFVNASAVGYFGDRGDEFLDESSGPGSGFLAEVCRRWEGEVPDSGIRSVRVRLGTVLSSRAGALPPLRTATRFFLGGPIGGGRQWFPWISLDDAVAVFARALEDEDVRGAVLAVAPEEVRQARFARELARSVGRPAIARVPGFVVRMLPGRIGELLLWSQRCTPRILREAGFRWRDPDLRELLGRLSAT